MRMDDKKYTWGDAGRWGYAPNDGCDKCGNLLNDCENEPVKRFGMLGQVLQVFCSKNCQFDYEVQNKLPHYSVKVDYFFGAGLNITAADLGYRDRGWSRGDIVEIEDWSEEKGSFTENYAVRGFEKDESGSIGARISYLDNSLES